MLRPAGAGVSRSDGPEVVLVALVALGAYFLTAIFTLLVTAS